MPDDTTPETGDVPSGDGLEHGAAPGPRDDPADLTRSMPIDTTSSMAQLSTPPAGTPVTPLSATGAAAGAGAGVIAAGAPSSDRTGKGGAGSSSQRAWIIALVAVAVLVVGAGIALAVTSGGGTKKKASLSAPEIPSPTVTTSPGPVCPLTGLPAPGGAVPQRPALAVKVDDYPDARPQSGIDRADIVFDEPVEGGITRFVAVFQCQSPPLIGPIRSARAVDVPILDQLSDPILIHVGGIDPVLALLQNANLTDFDLRIHGSIVQKVPGRVAPYDTYISAAAGWGLEPGDTKAPAPLFTYSSTPPSGTPTDSVHIPFTGTNNALWTWNATSGLWLLSYSGVPATVAGGGQISATNIVVQTVHVTYGPWLENSEGGLEVQSHMTGSGPLIVLRNGVAVTGTWSRAALNDPTTLTASDGSIIPLQPGQTWVEIVPSTVPITTAGSVSP